MKEDPTTKVPPCIGCEKTGCGPYHDKCPAYREYKEAMKQVYKTRLIKMCTYTIRK